MQSQRGTRALLIVGVLLILYAGYLGVRAIFNVYVERSKTELELAAEKLGVDASLEGIMGYVEKTIQPGMTREEVMQILQDVAPILNVDHLAPARFGNADNIIITFLQPNFPEHLSLLAEYDSDDKLIAIKEW